MLKFKVSREMEVQFGWNVETMFRKMDLGQRAIAEVWDHFASKINQLLLLLKFYANNHS